MVAPPIPTCDPPCPENTFCNAEGECIAVLGTSPELPEPLPSSEATGVGTLYGEGKVTPSGTFSYRIPITVPPGRSGLAPEVALLHTGSPADGELGPGWQIEGLSEIRRCPKLAAIDQHAAPIRFDGSDRYCLDMQHLFVVRPFDGSTTEYRTDLDTISRIRSNGDPGSPFTFTVWTKEGRTLAYSRRVLARNGEQVEAWLLETVTDRAGNTMDFRYREGTVSYSSPVSCFSDGSCGDESVLVEEISYGGLSRSGHLVSSDRGVRFAYEPRERVLTGYFRGSPKTTLQRLAAIHTYAQGKLARTYKVEYATTPASGVEYVRSVQECVPAQPGDAEATICKPATVFDYDVTEAAVSGSYPVPLPDQAEEMVVFRPDGIHDALVNPRASLRGRAAGSWELPVPGSTPGTSSGVEIYRGAHPRSYLDAAVLKIAIPDAPDLCIGPYSPIDIDGDGREELLDGCAREINGVWQYTALRFAWNETPYQTGEIQGTMQRLPLGIGGSSDPKYIAKAFALDIDGDGIKDVVTSDWNAIHVHFNRDQGAWWEDQALPAIAGSFQYSLKDDNRGLLWIPEEWQPPTPPVIDIDGDGVGNILMYDEDDLRWKALVVRGKADAEWIDAGLDDLPPTAFLGVATDLGMSFYQRSYKYIDLNGDGLVDLLVHQQLVESTSGGPETTGEPVVRGYLNTGAGFKSIGVLSGPLNNNDGARSVPWEVGYKAFARAVALDYDRNGVEELLVPKETVYGGLETTTEVLHWSEEEGVRIPVQTLDIPAYKGLRVLDFDGDGRTDILSVASDTLYKGTDQNPLRLSKVTDGLGNETEIFWGNGYYQGASNCNAETSCMHHVGRRVGEVHNSLAGHVLTEKVNYRYSDAQWGRYGRGWLGFGRVEETRFGVTKGTTEGPFITTTEYDNTTLLADGSSLFYPYAFRPKRIETRTPPADDGLNGSVPTSRVTIVDQDWEVRTTTDGRPFVYLDHRTSRTYDESGSGSGRKQVWSKDESFQVDGYGNPWDVSSLTQLPTSQGQPDTVEYRRVITTYNLKPEKISAWQINLPEVVWQQSGRGGNSEIRFSRLEFDARGLLHRVVREPGTSYYELTTDLERDDYGNVRKITATDASGRSRERIITYDTRGLFPQKVNNPLFQEAVVAMDPGSGQLQTLFDQNGRAIRNAYDGFGRLTRRETPLSGQTITYKGLGKCVGATDPVLAEPCNTMGVDVVDDAGPRMFQVLDGAMRPLRRYGRGYFDNYMTPLFVHQEFAYAWDGQMVTSSRPHKYGDTTQGEVEYTYDERRRLRSICYTDGACERYTYGSWRNVEPDVAAAIEGTFGVELVQSKSPTGKTGARALDPLGNTVASLDGLGQITKYVYGAFDELLSATDPAGNVITRAPDRYGRTWQITDPDLGQHRYSYLAFGDVSSHQNAKGESQEFTYDVLGRLTDLDSPDEHRSFTYDTVPADGFHANELGNLVEAVREPADPARPRMRQRYTYEPGPGRGLLDSVRHEIDGREYVVGLSYDAFGRTSQIRYPEAAGEPFAVKHVYDSGTGRPLAVQDAASPSRQFWQVAQAYQGYRVAQERLLEGFAGAGFSTTYTYDPLRGWVDRVTSRNAADEVSQDLHFGHHADGMVSERRDATLGALAEEFTYDALNRLTRRSSRLDRGGLDPIFTTLETFEYDDPTGNITRQSGIGSYAYPDPGAARPHAVQLAGNNSYHYDGGGNMIQRAGPAVVGGQQTLDYTSFDKPFRITVGDLSSPEGKQIDLEYDAFEQRVLKRSSAGGSTTYVGELYEREELTDGTVLHRYYVHAQGRRVVQVTRTEIDGTLADEHTTAVLSDPSGSTTTLTDETGTRLQRRHFGAFGVEDSPDAAPGNAARLRYGFTGQEHDDETGLVDMNARLYDPVIGRFVQADRLVSDPVHFQGMNRYSYAYNSPMNFSDPTGLQAEPYGGSGGYQGGGSPPSGYGGPTGGGAPGSGGAPSGGVFTGMTPAGAYGFSPLQVHGAPPPNAAPPSSVSGPKSGQAPPTTGGPPPGGGTVSVGTPATNPGAQSGGGATATGTPTPPPSAPSGATPSAGGAPSEGGGGQPGGTPGYWSSMFLSPAPSDPWGAGGYAEGFGGDKEASQPQGGTGSGGAPATPPAPAPAPGPGPGPGPGASISWGGWGPGYVDYNIQLGTSGIGLTFGMMANLDNSNPGPILDLHPYVGGGFMSPTVGVTRGAGSGSVSEGLNFQFQAGGISQYFVGAVGALGVAFSRPFNLQGWGEVGGAVAAPPGFTASATAFYVW